MNQAATTHNVVVTRVFNASPERVWRAWRDSADVKQWWGPAGWTCPLADMDFREGGTSLVCMRAPAEYGGMDMYNTWTYTKIEEPTRLEFINRFTDKDRNAFDPAAMGLSGVPSEVPHVITFKKVDDGSGSDKTEMTVTEYGYASVKARDLSQAGLVECLDKLQGLFA
jgi:uncharacterized protein YndB with AHSA1/START domain